MTLNDDFQRLTSRQIKPAQRRALRKLVAYIRDRNDSNGVTSVRFKIDACKYFAAVVITTRRSDCEKYSPRQIMCEYRVHAFIGPRGGITVKDAQFGFGHDGTAHLKKMIRYL